MPNQRARSVLLAVMPWFTPNLGSLAIGTLRPILEAHGIPTDTLYGSLLFPRTDSDVVLLERHGLSLFAPLLHDVDPEAVVERVVMRYFEDLHANAVPVEHLSFATVEQSIRRQVRADLARAEACLQRSFDAVVAGGHDVVGFSVTFEVQLPASLALARRLKAHDPNIAVMFGGAACVAEQGEALLRSFEQVDAVCVGEGEATIAPLVRALRGEGELAEVPGIVYRDASGALRPSPPAPLLRDLDALPVPRYDDFVAQVQESPWADLPLKLFFETSRGCWWGQKHLCSFCGLNGTGLAFRSKSPERAHDEIRALYERYPEASLLQAADNILHMGYFESLLPRLASLPREPGRPLRMFFEIKSNLRAEQVQLLRDAGMDAVQPGIESFHDDVLRRMDKGCTGLGQVQHIKYAAQAGLELVYNIIFGLPGDTVDEYEAMLRLLPTIEHLPPPVGITRLILMRFSPLYERRAHHGVQAVRPKAHYREVFGPGADVEGLAYEFDFDHPSHQDMALQRAYRAFAAGVHRWIAEWRPERLVWLDRGDHVVIVDRRTGVDDARVIGGRAAEIFRYLDGVRPVERVLRHFPDLEPAFVLGLLDGWRARRLIAASPDAPDLAQSRVLSVVPRHDAATPA